MKDANDINIVLKILRNHGENRKQLYLEEAQGVSNYIRSNLNEKDFIIQKKELSEVKWFDIDDVIDKIKKNDSSIVFDEKRLKLFEQLRNI